MNSIFRFLTMRHINEDLCRVAETCSLLYRRAVIAGMVGTLMGASALAAADSTSNSSNSSNSAEGASGVRITPRAPFAAFKIITVTNIFNTKRRADYKPATTSNVRYTRSESFGLVGVMTYDKGPFAFFEGSGSEYQKVLKPDETIAGFKLGEIQPGSVKLISPTNEVELKVGMQLARQDGGPWQLGLRPENLDSQITYKAQPAVPREERPQQDAQPFGFPPPGAFQNIPDSIAQGIQNVLQNGAPAGQPVIIQGQNGGNAVFQAAPQNGAPGEDVLQRLIRRRQQQEQGN
jgi:hypothetical protein